MTKRIYYEDSYQLEFSAAIVEQYRKGDQFAVILDQTAFYPASGGQMADRGFLNEQPLIDVIEEGDEIIHLLSEPFQESQVSGKVDEKRRFDFMQQHTGFHILAQSFLRVLRVETLSSHLGEIRDTIDINLPSLSWEQVKEVEDLANDIVFQNRPVKSFFVSKNEIETYPSLRKPPRFFNKPIRLVDIYDFDLDPCGGTHVRSTGEVGLIKILSWEKVRNAIRCTFVAGKRTLLDYQRQARRTQKLNQILSAKEEEIVEQVELLKQNSKSKDKQIKKLNEQRLQLELNGLLSEGKTEEGILWIKELREFQPQEIRLLAMKASKELAKLIVFFSAEHPAYLAMARGEHVPFDFSPYINDLRTILQGKGGGNPTFVEYNYCDSAQFSEVFEFLKQQFVDKGERE